MAREERIVAPLGGTYFALGVPVATSAESDKSRQIHPTPASDEAPRNLAPKNDLTTSLVVVLSTLYCTPGQIATGFAIESVLMFWPML